MSVKFLAQGNTTTGVASHFPINTTGSTGAMLVNFLAQGNHSKQHCLGIEPGFLGPQDDPKSLGLATLATNDIDCSCHNYKSFITSVTSHICH